MNIEEFRDKYNANIFFGNNTREIRISGNEKQEFYDDLKECLKNEDFKFSFKNSPAGIATKEEFLQAEKIIDDVIKGIQPDWNKKQIAAYVHYKMGKLVSYFPDYNFIGAYASLPVVRNTRNVWKSLAKGISVCGGISEITKNIMSRVGVSSEILSSGRHAFLLTEVEDGNIITDPTWDLSSSLFEGTPRYFGKTYEQLREPERGICNSHKLKEKPENVIEITEDELRDIFHSIGITNEDKTFKVPLLGLIDDINANKYENTKEKVEDLLHKFSNDFSDESKHLMETRSMLECCMYSVDIPKESIKTKFVYGKDDIDCENPYLTLSINDKKENEQMIYFLDSNEMKFKDIDASELESKYMVHFLDKTEPFWKKYLIREDKNKETEKGLDDSVVR